MGSLSEKLLRERLESKKRLLKKAEKGLKATQKQAEDFQKKEDDALKAEVKRRQELFAKNIKPYNDRINELSVVVNRTKVELTELESVLSPEDGEKADDLMGALRRVREDAKVLREKAEAEKANEPPPAPPLPKLDEEVEAAVEEKASEETPAEEPTTDPVTDVDDELEVAEMMGDLPESEQPAEA